MLYEVDIALKRAMPALAFDFLCSVFKKHHCGAHATRFRAGGAVLPTPEAATRGHSIRTPRKTVSRVPGRLPRLTARVNSVKRLPDPVAPGQLVNRWSTLALIGRRPADVPEMIFGI